MSSSAKHFLSQAASFGSVPRTLLLYGAGGAPLSSLGRELAASLVGRANSVDVRELVVEGKMGQHPIEGVREMIAWSHTSPYEGKAKVCIVHDAERMGAPAANALLKTLEEPAASTHFVLLSHRPDELLSTILSRCVRLFVESAEWVHGEAQGAILHLLQKSPSVAEVYASVEAIAAAEPEEGLAAQRYAEELFVAYMGWHRDQEARAIGAPLLYPQLGALAHAAIPLAKALRRVDVARDALRRNLPLATALKELLL